MPSQERPSRPTVGDARARVGRSRFAQASAITLALGAPSLALAQADTYFDRSNNTSVLERPRPEYAPLGVRVGAFLLSPKVTVSPEYDDNIFATPNNQQGDLVTVIEPEISAQSNWSRHELDAFARVITNVYVNQGTQDTTDFQLGGSGRYDIFSRAYLTGGLTYGHDTEPRTAENTVTNSRSPVQYDTFSGNVGAVQTLNRLQFSEQLAFDNYKYQDAVDLSGAPLPQGYRNRSDISFLGRADYALAPDLSVFVSAQFNDRPYDQKQLPFDRDSNGYEVSIGTSFDITRLTRGRIQVGYLEQDYNSKLFRPVTGPAVHATVEYFATPLTTFTVSVDREVVDAADPVASSLLSTQTTLRVDHELLRNVILSGRATYQNADFSGIQRTDDRESFSASATYLINRRLGLTAMYSFLNQNSSGTDRAPNYVVNVVGLSLVFQL